MKRYMVQYRVAVDMSSAVQAESLQDALAGPPAKIGDLVKPVGPSEGFDNWQIIRTGVFDPEPEIELS